MVKVNTGNRGRYNNCKTGKYFPLNRQKYKGSETPIYKSDLERRMMLYLDKNPMILQWGYEPQHIKYFDKSTNKVRNYYIDFVAIAKTETGCQKIWIEVKPKCQTHAPKNKKNIEEQKIWLCNKSKWEAARMLAESRGYKFVVISEEQLG